MLRMIDFDRERILGLKRYSYGAGWLEGERSLESRSKMLSRMLLRWLAVISLEFGLMWGVPVRDYSSLRLI